MALGTFTVCSPNVKIFSRTVDSQVKRDLEGALLQKANRKHNLAISDKIIQNTLYTFGFYLEGLYMCSTHSLVAIKVFLQRKDETYSCVSLLSIRLNVLTYLNSCNLFFLLLNTVPR